MCGFVGIISNKNILTNTLEQSINSIIYRGPDNKRILQSENYNFAFCRLAINDLSEKSNQPFQNNEAILLFNGEIYNFKELNKSFMLKSIENSDTSTLFELLNNKKNEDVLKELNGMFSFAFYNKKDKELFCARDRFGEKPFYYSIINQNTFIFSSEIKGILNTGLIKPTINPDNIFLYLKNSNLNNNQTIYKEIFSLPPGHYLKFKGDKLEILDYSVKKEKNSINFDEGSIISNFEKMFSDSIEKLLYASVEAGVLLSGGLDSSMIVSEASKLQKKLKTFSYGFSEGNNELKYARYIADKFKTEHYEFFDKDINVADMIILMQQIYDEPFSDTSNIPTYLISKLASRHVKVALTGDGADELLLGYSNWNKRVFKLNEVENSLLNNIFDLNFENKLVKNLTKYSIYLKYLKILYQSDSEEIAFTNLKSIFNDADLSKLGFNYEIVSKKKKFDKKKLLNSFSQYCISNYLPNNILFKSDRASMFNSLELRSPFLEKNISNMLLSIPIKYKLKNKDLTKNLLRIILKKRGVSSFVTNREKKGFGSPIKKWLKRKDIHDLKNSTMIDKNNKMYNFIDYKYAQNFLNKGNMKECNLLILATWFANNKYL